MATALSPSTALTQLEVAHLPPAEDGRVRFSRDAYHRMFEIGVLDRDKRFELLNGEIVMMSPIGPDQCGLIGSLNRFFMTHLPDSLDCRVQSPIVLDDRSEPEPDIALVRRDQNEYRKDHPRPADVHLIIEVSQSSLVRDSGQKMQIYARSGIQEYWIVDLEHRVLIVHRQPGPLGYADVQQLKPQSKFAPLVAPDCQIDLTWIFG